MVHIPTPVTPTVSNSTSPVRQPFCHNSEGWGPLSVFRYDFTPCFVDVPFAVIASFGILAGSFTVWRLLTRGSKQPTEKDWHYYTKLVSTSGIYNFLAGKSTGTDRRRGNHNNPSRVSADHEPLWDLARRL